MRVCKNVVLQRLLPQHLYTNFTANLIFREINPIFEPYKPFPKLLLMRKMTYIELNEHDMGYNKFKIEHLKDKLNLKVLNAYWLNTAVAEFSRDEILDSLLSEAPKNFLGSEKARSEFIVTPVLQALSRRNKGKFTIFSGYEFNIDKKVELNGFCDFILSVPAANNFIIEAPAFFVVETKKTDIDDNAIAQCAAELFAAQIFNAKNGKPQKAIYGTVTSGYTWIFLKLEGQTLLVDPDPRYLSFTNPYQVMATLQEILNDSLADINA